MNCIIRSMLSFVGAFIVFLHPLYAETPEGSEQHTIKFKDVSVREVVDELRRQFYIPIHLDAMAPDPKRDAITCERFLAFWDAKDSTFFTAYRKSLIIGVKRFVSRSPENRSEIAEYTHKLFDFECVVSKDDPGTVLDVLVKADPQYAWRKSNVSYIVFAKGIEYPNIKRFFLSNSDAKTAENALYQDVLLPAQLSTITIGKDRPLPMPSSGSISLNLADADVRTCLTRFAESLGSNVVWTIQGIKGPKGSRTVSFKKLKGI